MTQRIEYWKCCIKTFITALVDYITGATVLYVMDNISLSELGGLSDYYKIVFISQAEYDQIKSTNLELTGDANVNSVPIIRYISDNGIAFIDAYIDLKVKPKFT